MGGDKNKVHKKCLLFFMWRDIRENVTLTLFFNVYSQFRGVYGSSDYLKFKQVFFLFIYLRIFSYIVSRPNHIKISIRETSE